jgi:hypothetical protein
MSLNVSFAFAFVPSAIMEAEMLIGVIKIIFKN